MLPQLLISILLILFFNSFFRESRRVHNVTKYGVIYFILWMGEESGGELTCPLAASNTNHGSRSYCLFEVFFEKQRHTDTVTNAHSVFCEVEVGGWIGSENCEYAMCCVTSMKQNMRNDKKDRESMNEGPRKKRGKGDKMHDYSMQLTAV